MSNFFFHQYEFQNSYFPGSKYTRPGAERIRYDPARARELLAEAGWTTRDDQGYLVNEAGTRFPTLTFEFSNQGWLRIHNVMKHGLWDQVGIEMQLKLLDYTSLLKKVWEYKFDLVWWNWTASNFPAPEFGWHSKNADRPQTNNLNGFKNEEADRIIDKYELEFDPKERTKLLQRFDEILFETHPYALGWFSNYFRVLYWDHLGHPPEYAWRYGSDINNVLGLWWFDPDKRAKLVAARAAGTDLYPEVKNHQYDEVDQRYWLYNELPMEDAE
jgi:ABC-type transport system substrate-binding protein